MIFRDLPIRDAKVIEGEPHADTRGFMARAFCQEDFMRAGIRFPVAQCNLSHNDRRGTLRGLHWQEGAEAKVVRCVAGAVFDVIADLRPFSPTRGKWTAVELSAANRLSLYVPPGVAHGFQTLADDTDLYYLMSDFYAPAAARGVRWDDPDLAISWPVAPPILSDRDRALPAMADLP